MKPGYPRGGRPNSSGCVGVGLTVRTFRYAKGRVRRRRCYNAYHGGHCTQFYIDRLGQAEAFRRAVAWRAARELKAKGAQS